MIVPTLNDYKDKIIAKILANELPPKEEACVCKNISKINVEKFSNELTYKDVIVNFVKEYTVLCGPEKEPELYYRLSTFNSEYHTNAHFKTISQIKEYVILIHAFLNNPELLSISGSPSLSNLRPKPIEPKSEYEKELDKLRQSAKPVNKTKELEGLKLKVSVKSERKPKSESDLVGISARIPKPLYEKLTEYCENKLITKQQFFIEVVTEKLENKTKSQPIEIVTELCSENVSEQSSELLIPETEKPKSHREKQTEPNSVFYNGIGMKDKLGPGAELVDDTEFRKLFRNHYHIEIGEPKLLNSDERNLMLLVGRLTYKMRYSQIRFVTGIHSKFLYKFGYLLSLCKSNPAKIKKILQGCPVLTFEEVQNAYQALKPDIKRFKCIENYAQPRK